ncbi:uncharacterized protein MELLADRAFT_104335 [Melampsora larici-populina 98AG31]|uniref:Uncharacterized protein n=1 Tax=Melampsora larici-populina (strain 98AG31 / pathotype 3-4-7) TaxID=747676 RepID=F4REC8_MELLP|nr:uncharacterized protein MELLADRAFT_104335 [Melampsora larici-populina 98AG31]EGG09069.1 hypothetical protein MELLADRAFT_104335 [Melampsora larici-populina 98AG31]
MDHGLRSALDLKALYAKKEAVPDCDLVKALIYSGSRNATFEVMKVINKARGTPKGEHDPDSSLIRRYHSCIGNKEKERGILGYTKDEFPLISIYKLHYIKIFGDDDYCESEDYFGIGEARTIVNSLDNIKQSQDIEQAMGGDIIEGGVKLVFEYLEEWRKQDIALQYSQKQAKLLEMKRKADDKRVLADVTNVKQIPTGPAAATKKKRRSSAQVKADKEAAILKADFNRRCLKWMKEDNVPADKLDEREEAYQNDLKQQASGNAQVDFCDTRL